MARPEKSSGASDTPWLVPDLRPSYPPLDEDLDVDVAVIGAGIAGLTTAYLLTLQGHRVAVLEDGRIAGGESGRTTAHLASALDDRFDRLIRLHGEDGARLAYESHAGAKDDSTDTSLWIWLAGTAILSIPAAGNFLRFGV